MVHAGEERYLFKENFMIGPINSIVIVFVTALAMLLEPSMGIQLARAQEQKAGEQVINLQQPVFDGAVSVERALLERRSIRTY
jgi:hypothetical protein